ncbi:bifunctional hydroxymethylpyrimidine kinase/phosphomethylpyrimidine kinase [uncultured Ruminococcus sp.]|uniref:bifunctional hydroxymethylpyrimidine kinase/phosphomethylpyrimidine kinase n=1 Tax=uncultured Ruminococcus sp. TaxID=165186 RepID=UPI00266BE711|nr:bifunctional hydroxymethylpyrimidine kinase/phosphomethylpyrimidine kinase [uncultured Ruminococcus sp.]
MAPVLTIAGSDSSGGAGVQADLKTMTMLGCFGMSAITALTAQNTLGVQGICPVPAEFLKQQIAAVCEDIPPAAVKVGMVYDTPQILAIAEAVAQYQLPHVVVDPVMVATSGDPLLKQQAQQTLTEQLFPLAELLTPNLPEAEQLTGTSITSPPQMEQAARQLSETYHTAVLLKGGHSVGSCNDLLYAAGTATWFSGQRTDTPNTHGTGCTLSSAIASFLAQGASLEESVRRGKAYISGAIAAGLSLGHGHGPIAHNYAILKAISHKDCATDACEKIRNRL